MFVVLFELNYYLFVGYCLDWFVVLVWLVDLLVCGCVFIVTAIDSCVL